MQAVPDKIHKNIVYYDKEHLYIDTATNERCISVTTLIGEYKQKFDGEFWASYKALEQLLPYDFYRIKSFLLKKKKFSWINLKQHLIELDKSLFITTKQQILDEYELKKKIACERGTKIHAEFENNDYAHEKQSFNGKSDFICKKSYYELDLVKGIYPEYLIYGQYKTLKIAGQIDRLIKDGNELYIHDFKSNAKIDDTSYYNSSTKKKAVMNKPLNNLQDCNLIHYTLQLSLYAYLLQQMNPDFIIKELKLIHIDHNNIRKDIEVQYLKDDVIKLLDHYEKKQKITKALNKNEKRHY